jgi:hypothetical protein
MQVLERNRLDKEDLRLMAEDKLKQMGVKMLDRKEVVLQCAKCGLHWQPDVDSSGKLAHEFWVCPSKCNLH